MSLKPIYDYLRKNLLGNISFYQGEINNDAVNASKNLIPGEVLLMENIRFFKEEENDDENFAKNLSKLGDFYINEAFSCSHRKQASLHKITKYIDSYGGPLLEKEIQSINLILKNKKEPVTSIIGGSKVSTKINVLLKLIQNANNLIIVGAMANNFLKFKGNDVSSISKQKIRCAEIIGKTGSKIGGKDFDQWIVDYFIQGNNHVKNLSKAEKIKCKLSSSVIKYENKYPIKLFTEQNKESEYYLSKEIFEKILIENNLLNHLNSLLKDLLNQARGKFCTVDDLYAIVLVGGGTQIPLIKEWITKKIPKIQIKSPPPIESIALGALAMTPGVKIKDILNKGLSIKLFNKREQKHFWHPIFCKGQTWPTENSFKLILQASKNNQKIFEIIIGETQKEGAYDVIFENGLPKLSEVQNEEKIIKWDKKPLKIVLKNVSNIGQDNLKLFFKITESADLLVKCFDIQDEFLGEYNLGNIY